MTVTQRSGARWTATTSGCSSRHPTVSSRGRRGATGALVTAGERGFDTPTAPGIVLIAMENFPSERNPEPPPRPKLFPKGIRTLVRYDDDVVLPSEPSRVMAEPEMAVVIGATARNVAIEDVDDYVYGFACFNDVTAVFDDGRGSTSSRPRDATRSVRTVRGSRRRCARRTRSTA